MQQKSGGSIRSKFFEQGLNNLSLEDNCKSGETSVSIKLPPPPPAPLSPVVCAEKSPSGVPPKLSLEEQSGKKASESEKYQSKESESPTEKEPQDIPDDDFGDFQAAG